MFNFFIILTALFISTSCYGQASNDRIMFVVDSIPVIDDPEEGNDILDIDVADITVIKNKDSLARFGYGEYDGLTFIFTKEYRSRPDSIKRIPSSKQMQRQGNAFSLNGRPYSGRFIDYYFSGRKQGEGIFRDGKVNGTLVIYYQDGRLKTRKVFKDGVEDGWNEAYYEDGVLKQKGEFYKGKEKGMWESYFPNGQLKLRSFYKDGEVTDSAFTFYSTGKINERVFIKNGKVTPDPRLKKITQLMSNSRKSNEEGDTKAAINYCSKVIELDSTYPAAYFSRGTIRLNDFKFDEAISDFNSALKFEPFLENALAKRAFARIRKYQFGTSRVLDKNKDVTVLASKDKVPLPAEENEKICNDLHQAIKLGARSEMITEALADFCSTKSSR